MADEVALDELLEQTLEVEEWSYETVLGDEDEPSLILVDGSLERLAVESGTAEIAAGNDRPSPQWKTRFGFALGLSRLLREEKPKLPSGTILRAHQVDALAGMLDELTSRLKASVVGAEGDSDLGDPGRERRFRFRHPTGSGKTIAAAGFVEAGFSLGILILTHRRLLVDQLRRELADEGFDFRLSAPILAGQEEGLEEIENPVTIETYAWFARNADKLSPTAYQLVICDEAHTALGEKTTAAIRAFSEPIYIAMTATEKLLAKDVAEVFPASIDELPLTEAVQRGLIAPLRCLRVPPVAKLDDLPIVAGDFDREELSRRLNREMVNEAAASFYKERFGVATPGIVYAAGVEHAADLAFHFNRAGISSAAVSGKTARSKLRQILADYEAGELTVLINAQLLTEGWNSPRATVCVQLAPTASRRVYQQRVGRVMRLFHNKEAGIVIDFAEPNSPHDSRVITMHSLLDSDLYQPGALVTPPSPVATAAVPLIEPEQRMLPLSRDIEQRLTLIRNNWRLIDPGLLPEDEQLAWATAAGKEAGIEDEQPIIERLLTVPATVREEFFFICAADNNDLELRLRALRSALGTMIDVHSFDRIVQGSIRRREQQVEFIQLLLEAIGSDRMRSASDELVSGWVWQLARLVKGDLDAYLSGRYEPAGRVLSQVIASRGETHEQRMNDLVQAALDAPLEIGVCLLAIPEDYTPRARQILRSGRERIAFPQESAAILGRVMAEHLGPPPEPIAVDEPLHPDEAAVLEAEREPQHLS